MNNLFKDQRGSVLVLAAIAMIAIIGFAALAIDGGYMYYQKSHLQSAADAAALAGALAMGKGENVEDVVVQYAGENIKESHEIADPIVDTTEKTVLVTITQNTPKFFAGILTSDNYSVSASAKAKYIGSGWAGEGLPFINLGFDYSITDPAAWTKVGPGIKGTITDFYTRNSGSDDTYFEVDYANGITVTPGYANGTKGLDDSKLSDGISEVLTQADKDTKIVYVFSLKSDIIKSGKFTVNNKTKTVYLNKLNKLNNGDIIDPDQLVLIRCLFNDCKWSNHHDIELTYLNKVYDIMNGEFPTDYISGGSSGSSKLIMVEE